MQALNDNKEVMQQLGDKIEDAAADLTECEEDLTSIIWKEVSL